MRNVIYAINITIDGCCDHTKTIDQLATREKPAGAVWDGGEVRSTEESHKQQEFG